MVTHVINLQTTSKTLALLLLCNFSAAIAEETEVFRDWYWGRKPGISSVKFDQYNEVCGNCHFPYQPGLLPAMSWEKIMSGTDNHFGTNLALPSVEKRTVARYLLDNAAGRVNDDISNRILKSMTYDPVVIRITETPFFIETHRKLHSAEASKDMGRCDACHQEALQGKY